MKGEEGKVLIIRRCACGSKYQAVATAPLGSCDDCLNVLAARFWALYDKQYGKKAVK
jgi:hypothetical protein